MKGTFLVVFCKEAAEIHFRKSGHGIRGKRKNKFIVPGPTFRGSVS